ncbi:hypothetical protein DCE93_13705 [Agromyces badenianii]|uniref:Mucin-associated surface protein n=1 Tax=Agromyces badenianii TaxID=2080742 RepID=A0A2S0WYX6_9MICO|nr:hypothetical protein [Agromyces badenianii]AWB96569.1 hypothetical protein DCE93_13705 [Agromyces badenianii]
MMRLRSRTALGAAFLAASLALGLTACGQSAESIGAELHASVVQVAERAASGDYVGAIAELALLEKDVNAAVDDGTIGAEQAQEIREALALVQADLEAAEIATTPAPTPVAPVDDSGPGNSDGNGNDKGNKGDKGNKNDKGEGNDDD